MLSVLIVTLALLSAGPEQEPAARGGKITKPADPVSRAEYLALRAKTADTADAHWKLGQWCERKGLESEALIEFQAVIQLDRRRDAAWKKLGYVKYGGRWITAAEQAAEKAETEAQRKADTHWRPLLQKWKAALGQKNKRAEAEVALAAVNDPRATPSIWTVFALGSPEDQERAIDMLGHIEGNRPAHALAALAIFGKTDRVRRAAVETVTRRKADDVMIAWIGLMQPPIKYEVRQVAGPGMPGVLFLEGDQFNSRRFYAPPNDQQTQHMLMNGPNAQNFELPTQYDSTSRAQMPPPGSKCVGAIGDTALFVFDYTWAPPPPPPGPTQAYQVHERVLLQAQIDRDFTLDETAKMAAGAQAQLQHDVNMVEQANATIRERNARLNEALGRVAGVDLGVDREAWLAWWMKRKGYSYIPPEKRTKKTVDVQVPLPYVPQHGPPTLSQGAASPTLQWCMFWEHDKGQQPKWNRCFARGTLVLTPAGQRAIESLRAGDLVVTGDSPERGQHTATIVSTHQSDAVRTLRLIMGGESIITTDGHPFQKVGAGWTRAGDLKPGDSVRTMSGQARVEACESRHGETVWNLRLVGGSRFMVGNIGVVVHDLSPVEDLED